MPIVTVSAPAAPMGQSYGAKLYDRTTNALAATASGVVATTNPARHTVTFDTVADGSYALVLSLAAVPIVSHDVTIAGGVWSVDDPAAAAASSSAAAATAAGTAATQATAAATAAGGAQTAAAAAQAAAASAATAAAAVQTEVTKIPRAGTSYRHRNASLNRVATVTIENV